MADVWLTFGISVGNYSIANNTTPVTVTVYANWNYNYYNLNKKAGTLTINGTPYSFSSAFNTGKLTNGGRSTLFTKSVNIAHRSDGTQTLSVSASYATGVVGTVSASTSRSLATIPRASDVSCPENFTVDATGTITLTRKSTGFTHTATTSFGDEGLSATTDIATSFTYTPPISLFDSSDYSSVATRSGTITVQTKSGTTNIGSAVVSNISVILPENSVTKPTCSLSNTLVEYGSSYLERYGVLIAGKSRLKTTCSSVSKLSSNIASHHFSIPGSSATRDSNNNVITDYLKASSGETAFSYYVKDSRGFTSETSTITNPYKVVDYRVPSITSLTAMRVNESGAEDPVNGTGIKFKVNYFVDPIAVSDEYMANTATINIYLLEMDDEGNIVSRERVTNSDGSALAVINGELTDVIAGNYPVANTFTFEATIVDEITTEEAILGTGLQTSVLTAKALMSFYKADGITFGRVAEKAGFNVMMPASFDEEVFVNDDDLKDLYTTLFNKDSNSINTILKDILTKIKDIDSDIDNTETTSALDVYPVGSVYISYNSTSPAELFGGTWTSMTGVFPYFNAGTATGGSNTHTLTTTQMPSHAHTVYGTRASTNTGTSNVYVENWTTMANDRNTTTSYSGGSGSHNNMPAYQSFYAWRRTA